jgi:hypothetical protein
MKKEIFGFPPWVVGVAGFFVVLLIMFFADEHKERVTYGYWPFQMIMKGEITRDNFSIELFREQRDREIPENVVCAKGSCRPAIGYKWDSEGGLKTSGIDYDIKINGKDPSETWFFAGQDISLNLTPFHPLVKYKVYHGDCDNPTYIASLIGASGLYIKNLYSGCYIIEIYPRLPSGGMSTMPALSAVFKVR